DGQVSITLHCNAQQATVEIKDDGAGMDLEFIRDRLFRPFDTTKGLTGMGIGVFESREFIRSIGGNISVDSTLGEGSTFSIVLPCKLRADERQEKSVPEG
ncbi:MAG: PEP-CTERM system histidine kinase PrsK, partial [Gammaproteobacteria bacterium]|nr:PEP-CTERM system histidine kinase PrsK [Gammaproteobacteria bacterium]